MPRFVMQRALYEVRFCSPPICSSFGYHNSIVPTRFANVRQRSTHGSPSSLRTSSWNYLTRSCSGVWSLWDTIIQPLGILPPLEQFIMEWHNSHGHRIQSSERQLLTWLYCVQLFIFASTFADMIIVALPDAQTAGAVATLLFSMTMIFNGYFSSRRVHLRGSIRANLLTVFSNRHRPCQASGSSCTVSVH